MKRTVTLIAALLALAIRDARAAEPALKLVLVLTGDAAYAGETSAGVALAAAASNDLKAGGAKRPAVEVTEVTAADAAVATAAIEDAAKKKLPGVVALSSEACAAELEAAARKAKLPLVLLGPSAAARTIDPADPVLRVEPSAIDRALALHELLRFRVGKSSLGLPAETKHAWLVVEDAAWARAIAASLRSLDDGELLLAGDTLVKRGGALDTQEMTKARKAACDRVVLIGTSGTLSTARAAFDGSSWDVPILAVDAALDGPQPQGPPKTKRGIAFPGATPAWAAERHLDEVVSKHPPAAGRGATPTPATVRAFVAASALIDAAAAPSRKGVVGALRELMEGSGARAAELFDASGCVDRWRWTTWVAAADGTVAPAKASFLPDATIGPLLGPRQGARFKPVPGAPCMRVNFGGGDGQPARTIDADLATLGLFSGGPGQKVDELVREQLLARTAAKLSRIYLRNRDGTTRPALSFKIAVVPDGAPVAGASVVWDAVVAGDGNDGTHGGLVFPAARRCQALSTYLLRNAAPLQQAKLTPPLSSSDLPYLDGTYAWAASGEGNARSEALRALIEGVASTFCMKLAKESGHLAGLSVEHSGNPRSIMITKGGEGVPDEFATIPPQDLRTLEKTLGREGAPAR